VISDVYSNPESTEDDIKRVNKEKGIFKTQEKIKSFNRDNSDNEISRIDREFLNVCAMMESNHTQNPSKLSVLQFYAKIDYLKKQVKNVEDVGD
jgi:3-methyladenine DNA glycosylase Tag